MYAALQPHNWPILQPCKYLPHPSLCFELLSLASGDYLSSIPGIGIRSAHQIIRKHGAIELAVREMYRLVKCVPTSEEFNHYATEVLAEA